MSNKNQTCIYETCDKQAHSRDLCNKHYNQMKKTPEWQEREQQAVWEFVKKELRIQ